MISLIFKFIISTQISWSSEPVDFNSEFNRLSFKEFIGAYQGFSSDEIGSLFISEDHLHFYYVNHGMVFTHFNIPISLENSIQRYSTFGMLFGTDETHYYRESNLISKTRVTQNKFRKIIDETIITLTSDTQLEIKRRRRYFYRKNIFYGPWVLDDLSYIAKVDSVDKRFNYFKSSAKPVAYNYLSNFAQMQNPIVVSAPQRLVDKDKGTFHTTNTNHSDNEPGQVFQINDFRKNNCYTYLR